MAWTYPFPQPYHQQIVICYSSSNVFCIFMGACMSLCTSSFHLLGSSYLGSRPDIKRLHSSNSFIIKFMTNLCFVHVKYLLICRKIKCWLWQTSLQQAKKKIQPTWKRLGFFFSKNVKIFTVCLMISVWKFPGPVGHCS